AHRIVQVSGGKENAVTKLFRVETLLFRAPVQTVAGILRKIFCIVSSAELIDRAQHDLPLKSLHGHSMGDKVASEILEQFRNRWTLAGSSKVTGCIHDTGSKMCFPDSIDENPHGKRLLCDRFSKLEAPASLCKGLRIALGKK